MALSTKAAAFSIDALLSRQQTPEADQLYTTGVHHDPQRSCNKSAYPILDATLSKPLSLLHLHETRTLSQPQSAIAPPLATTSAPSATTSTPVSTASVPVSTSSYDFSPNFASIESRLSRSFVRQGQFSTATKLYQRIAASPANLPEQKKPNPVECQWSIPSFKIHHESSEDGNSLASKDSGRRYSAQATISAQKTETEESLLRRHSMTSMPYKTLAVDQWVKSTLKCLETGPQKYNTSFPMNNGPVSQTVNGITATLVNADLWKKFNKCGTEMILNRAGRRMFPGMLVSIEGLDESALYRVRLHISPADVKRYKFINCQWLPIGKADSEVACTYFEHADSPNTGAFWMKGNVSFSKLKITNNKENSDKNIVLNSMHKYIPRVLITRDNTLEGAQSEVRYFSFPETEFIAVTAYQNEQITQLKIQNNPFAKAFRDADVALLLQGAYGLSHDSTSGFGDDVLKRVPRRGSTPDHRPYRKLSVSSEAVEIRRRSLPYTIPPVSYLRPPPIFGNFMPCDPEGAHLASSLGSSTTSLVSQESGFGDYPFPTELSGKVKLKKAKSTEVYSEKKQSQQHEQQQQQQQPPFFRSSSNITAGDMYWAHSQGSRISTWNSLSTLQSDPSQLNKRRSEMTDQAGNLCIPPKRCRSISPARMTAAAESKSTPHPLHN